MPANGRGAQHAPKGINIVDVLKENGAGEAIRTPDPNLGKVVLYP